MAWLTTAPKSKGDDKPKIRFETLREDSPARALPQTDEYLVMIFELMGRCVYDSMGKRYLNWQDIDSFCRRSAYELNGWDCEQIISMSKSYVYMTTKAEEPNCKPPYKIHMSKEEEMQQIRDAVNDQLDKIF